MQRLPELATRPWLSGMLVTADLVTVGAVVYLTGIPQVSQRFLIVALLFVPLAAFYFGVWQAVYAALLSGAALDMSAKASSMRMTASGDAHPAATAAAPGSMTLRAS